MIMSDIHHSSALADKAARRGRRRGKGGLLRRICAWLTRVFRRSRRAKSGAGPLRRKALLLSGKAIPLAARREKARLSLGRSIVQAYCAAALLFALSGCWLAAVPGGEERLKALLGFAQALGAAFNPVAGFVVGHYFARREG